MQQKSVGVLNPSNKLVIALCRRPFDDVDDELDASRTDANKKEQMSDDGQSSQQGNLEKQIINNSGYLEYNKNNLGQIYHVEEVLSIIDIANEGAKQQANGVNQLIPGMGAQGIGLDQQMHNNQNDMSSIFHNEMM